MPRRPEASPQVEVGHNVRLYRPRRLHVWVVQPGDTPLKIERYARFEHIARGNFQVDAVRRVAFTVNARASRDSYVVGEVFGGHVSAHYLHDAKMAGLPVTHTLSRNATSYSPPGYDGFQFGAVGSSGGVSDSTLHRTETVLDSTGRIDAPRVRLPGTAEGFPTEVAWKATVTSPFRQRIWDQATATLHPGRFYVGLKPSASVVDLSEDSTLAVEVVTVDPEGTPVAGKTVTIDVVRRPHRNDEQAETVVRSVTMTTDSSGTRMLRTALPEGGQYRLEATSRDGRGNIIRTETHLYASGGATAWQKASGRLVEVEPARTRVVPGETAQLMIKSPYEEATALITIEREGIVKSRVTMFTGQDPTIDLPITEDYVPNATVKILLLKGRTTPPENASDPGAPGFKIGQASLLVDPDRKRLQVEIEPDRSTYRPGEKVTADLRLTNAEGEGVPGEIAFSAADAGILNRIDYQLPDPFKTFYAARGGHHDQRVARRARGPGLHDGTPLRIQGPAPACEADYGPQGPAAV